MKTVFLKIARLATVIRAHFVRRQYRQPAAAPGEGQTATLPLAAAGFTHDLNNLLTLIVMNSQLGLQESQEAKPRRRWLEVLEAGQLAADLTRQFVGATRQHHEELQAVSPNAVVRDARELLARLAGNRVAIQTQLADDAGVILISPIELLQILMNLILNARDAMPSGGTLNIETARKFLHPGTKNGTAGIRGGWYFILTVTDNGRGIEEEARSRIFEAFFSTKPTGEGAGLGLAIVNAIIRKYGGQISVKTQLGAGTSFHLYFPVGVPHEDDHNMASPRLSRLHSLDHATIDSTVTQKAPGVYALDNSSHGWFEAAYIGRSDDDLNAALHRHVGSYRFFKYTYSPSASEAFGAECELYHRHKPSDNAAHPVSQSDLPCPRCQVAD